MVFKRIKLSNKLKITKGKSKKVRNIEPTSGYWNNGLETCLIILSRLRNLRKILPIKNKPKNNIIEITGDKTGTKILFRLIIF